MRVTPRGLTTGQAPIWASASLAAAVTELP